MLASAILSVHAFSQHFACHQDTVHFYQSNYRGKLIWQKSDNGRDWTQLPGPYRDTLMIVGTSSAFYRSEVIEGSCKSCFSDAIQLIINELPDVKLEFKDSVCVNTIPFILDGGVPAGGSYSGTGIIDGKFMASIAGSGKHKVLYSYRDSLTGCVNTASAYLTVSDLPNKSDAGKDVTLIFADSVQLKANSAENGIGTWTLVKGAKGHFSNIHSPNTWFFRDSLNLDFTLRWSISSNCGQSSDDVSISFFPLSKKPCPGAPTVTDADGNVYPTIQIGTQCWMAKNLNVGHFVLSTSKLNQHSDVSNNGIYEKYCYENKIENCQLYGGLYDWNEAMCYKDEENTQGICPNGWHIPGNPDWAKLNLFFDYGNAGELMKVGGSSGFQGYLSGNRNPLGQFFSFDANGYWWQSTSYPDNGLDESLLREIAACNDRLERTHFLKKTGLSVRCIKNNP
jgi:uncharacterized protein (TIGR02145 family)